MTALRSFAASLGIALAVLGLTFVLLPQAAGTLGLPRLGVLLVGLFALIEAVRSLSTRRRTSIDGAEPPDPERRTETGWPGDDFDDRVRSAARTPGRSWRGTDHDRLERRLRAAAVEAAAHRWRLSTDAARERIDDGDWTDDPAAAWFIGGPEVDRPPWSVRARAVLAANSSLGFYANRTADAVVALREAA